MCTICWKIFMHAHIQQWQGELSHDGIRTFIMTLCFKCLHRFCHDCVRPTLWLSVLFAKLSLWCGVCRKLVGKWTSLIQFASGLTPALSISFAHVTLVLLCRRMNDNDPGAYSIVWEPKGEKSLEFDTGSTAWCGTYTKWKCGRKRKLHDCF